MAVPAGTERGTIPLVERFGIESVSSFQFATEQTSLGTVGVTLNVIGDVSRRCINTYICYFVLRGL